MNSLHLFAGIGGGILADKILGNTIVGAVEINKYCRKLLQQKQDLGILEKFPIFEDVTKFKGDEVDGRIDLVCGGFPCQDISIAGKGVGIEGKRSSLFFELIRIIARIRPKFIFLENSSFIVQRGLDKVLLELAKLGYDAEWSRLSAGICGAPHRRDRWWCLCQRQNETSSQEYELLRRRLTELGLVEVRQTASYIATTMRGDRDSVEVEEECLADSQMYGQSRDGVKESLEKTQYRSARSSEDGRGLEQLPKQTSNSWWQIEPDVGRVVNELPNRVDRLKGLGNAQVPICAALAFYLLLRRFQNG